MDIIRRKPNSNSTAQNPNSNVASERQIQENHFFEPQSKPIYITRQEIEKFSSAERKYQKGLLFKKFLKYFCLAFFIFLLLAGFFLAWKTYAVSKKISIDGQNQSSFSSDMSSVLANLLPNGNHKQLQGQQDGRVNILLLGAAGEKKPGQNLTDTIMVMSLDLKNKKIAMLSLPRDLYVQIPSSSDDQKDTKIFTKINGLYQDGLSSGSGVSLIKKSVEKITGLSIQYYLVVNFDGFEKLINDIGGINVTVERDIYDATYPGPNYSYQTFEIKKGFHKLDGATALKYVRERHDDPQGDFGRAKRQQQVIQAVKNKIFSAQTMLNVVTINNMLDTLGENIKTNISFEELESFLALAKQLDTENINNVVVDAWKSDSLLKVSHVQAGNVRAFILVPRVGSYSEIQDLAANIFDRDALQKRKKQIQNEAASIALVNQSSDPSLATKIRTLLVEKLGFVKIDILPNTANLKREQSAVLDHTNQTKLYSLDELIKKIPAKLETGTENFTLSEKNDIIVLLGEDAADNYKYEEDSLDDYNKAQDDNIDFSVEKNN